MQYVMEFKHHFPYDGCYWEYQYLLVDVEDNIITDYEKIHFYTDRKNRKLFPATVQNMYDEMGTDSIESFYSDVKLYEITDNLYLSIPDNHIPIFWLVIENFIWKCDECGLTNNQPVEVAGYHGNGGIGITVDGWLCSECFENRMFDQEEYDEEDEVA